MSELKVEAIRFDSALSTPGKRAGAILPTAIFPETVTTVRNHVLGHNWVMSRGMSLVDNDLVAGSEMCCAGTTAMKPSDLRGT